MISTAKNRNTIIEGAAGGGGITSLTGDVIATGPGAASASLSPTGVAAGTYGDSTHVGQFTVDVKGRISLAANVAIAAYTPPTYTTGSVLFAGVSGAPTQDNTNFFFNDSTDQLKVAGSILSPLIIGGTGTTDDLILQATSGVGTTGSWIFFKVGNNGAVTAMEINDVGGVGIGTTGLITVDTALVVRKANPPDIGYVARFISNLTAYVYIQTGTGANEQAGFALKQNTNGFEWRFACIGNDANAFRIAGGTGGTDIKCTVTQNGNLHINDSRIEPTTGTKCLVLGDGTIPATLASDSAILFADDVSGTVNLFGINEAGVKFQLTGGPSTAGYIPFVKTGGTAFDGVGGLAWDITNAKLVLATTGQTLDNPATNETPQLFLGGNATIVSGAVVGAGSVYLDGYGAQPLLTMRRADGTQASKSAVASGAVIFNLRAYGWDGSDYGQGCAIRTATNGTFSTSNHGMDFLISLVQNGSVANATERWRVSAGATIIKATVAGAFGHQSPSGGTVGQLTSKATGVTLDKATGAITTFNDNLNAATTVSFTFTNAYIEANDLILILHKSGGTQGAYAFQAFPAGGTAVVSIRNITAGNLAEAIVMSFSVIKGVTN